MDINQSITRQFKVLCPGDPIDGLGPSIFLAGPTPRHYEVTSWRPLALECLEGVDFRGTVLAPERSDWKASFDYDDQVEWELKGLDSCTVIAFWVPRDMATLPGLTTNCEFGLHVKSGRVVYGRPIGAQSTRYLDYLYEKFADGYPYDTLSSLMSEAARRATKGASNG